jgi:HlyD family secretion protein
MKKLLVMLSVLWGGGALVVWYWNDSQAQHVAYRTIAVRRGDLRSTINATGTIEPEQVVEVGAQVPGQVQAFGVDPRDPKKPVSYGTHVEPGTVLARLDDALLRARVDQAKGRVARAEADIEQAQVKLGQAERERDRTQKLRARNAAMVAVQDYDTAVTAYESARAALAVNQGTLAIARADLAEAAVSLNYATIRSPVKGVILDRRVNLGQTVSAGAGVPSLFLIARDLGRLEIWSSVNEADIGSIHEGQVVRFTVSSLPREQFEGKVSQIRLNASMAQSVVTYTVVSSVDNSGGRLLPYLTARLTFEVEVRRHVLLVPNAALRWQPRVQNVIPEARETYALSLRRRTPDKGQADRPDADSPGDEACGLVWLKQGEMVRPVEVRVGLSDGVLSEVAADGLLEGTQVVIGASRVESDADATSILPHTWSEPPKK